MAKYPICAKSVFYLDTLADCMGGDGKLPTKSGGRLLSESDEDSMLDDEEPEGGSDYHLREMRATAEHKERMILQEKMSKGEDAKVTKLKDGSLTMDIAQMDSAVRSQMAKAMGIPDLSSGRIVFNASESEKKQSVPAMLDARELSGSAHSRRLMLDTTCLAPGVVGGCLFSVSYPKGCDPIDNEPKCKWGLAVKVQIGGSSNGALTVGASGCIESWAFSVPKPLDGTICLAGGITVTWKSACGLPFSLEGWVEITATVGLDMVIFSFSAASIGVRAGVSLESYQYNCDDRRRSRRRWGGRRRGRDKKCQTSCDVKVYAKATIQILIGRGWIQISYYVRNRDFQVTVGADVYIWALFTSWWEGVCSVRIV